MAYRTIIMTALATILHLLLIGATAVGFGGKEKLPTGEEWVEYFEGKGWWVSSNRINQMDGRPEITMSLKSVDLFADEQPELIIVCEQGESRVRVNMRTDVRLKGDFDPIIPQFTSTTVRVRFDNGRPVRQKWVRSPISGYDLWPSDEQMLVKQLAKANVFWLEFHPKWGSSVTVKFLVGRFGKHLPTVVKACDLKQHLDRNRHPGPRPGADCRHWSRLSGVLVSSGRDCLL